MPTIQKTAVSGVALWNEQRHKKAELLGLTIDNQSDANITAKLYDCFTAVSGIFASGGAAQAHEIFGATSGIANCLSGKIRLPMTVPAGETHKLGESDCKGIEFLGSAYLVCNATETGCIIVAQYKLN